MELKDKVRAARLEKGMTQEDLAKKMGYSSRVSINKIEMGRPVSQKIIYRLADALNVDVAYLFGWEENEKQPDVSEIDMQIAELIMNLPAEKKEEALHYLQYLAGK